MSKWQFALVIAAFVMAVGWLAFDFLRDLMLFLAPRETIERRLRRDSADGAASRRAIDRLNKPNTLIALSVAGLIGMAVTLWIILG